MLAVVNINIGTQIEHLIIGTQIEHLNIGTQIEHLNIGTQIEHLFDTHTRGHKDCFHERF